MHGAQLFMQRVLSPPQDADVTFASELRNNKGLLHIHEK
jgi:hypothetical protein